MMMVFQPIGRSLRVCANRLIGPLSRSSTRDFTSRNNWLIPGGGFPLRPSGVFGELQNRIAQIEREFDRFFGE